MVLPVLPTHLDQDIVYQGWLLKKRRKKMQGTQPRLDVLPDSTIHRVCRVRASLFRAAPVRHIVLFTGP